MGKGQEKSFVRGIPVLFICGSLFHFIYELSGELPVVGLLAPVNESVFEHAKLFPLPAALWYLLLYLRHKKETDAGVWSAAALLAIAVNVSSLFFLYYFYTGAFGVSSLAVDIAAFFAAVALGQMAGLHYYRHGKGLACRLAVSLICGLLMVFALLTLAPPHLPLFLDPLTNTYGI